MPSYDLWEQQRGIHLFTCAALYGALSASVKLATKYDKENADDFLIARDCLKRNTIERFYDQRLGRFARRLIPNKIGPTSTALDPDLVLDSSMAGIFLFGLLPADDPRVVTTMDVIYDRLWVHTPIGGLARYEDDYYFQANSDVRNVPGNPWFISTLWMADWYIATANSIRDLEPAMDLLNWVVNHASEAGLLAEQIHPTTGQPLSVMPLTWSHAAFVSTVMKYQTKIRELAGLKTQSPPLEQ